MHSRWTSSYSFEKTYRGLFSIEVLMLTDALHTCNTFFRPLLGTLWWKDNHLVNFTEPFSIQQLFGMEFLSEMGSMNLFPANLMTFCWYWKKLLTLFYLRLSLWHIAGKRTPISNGLIFSPPLFIKNFWITVDSRSVLFYAPRPCSWYKSLLLILWLQHTYTIINCVILLF